MCLRLSLSIDTETLRISLCPATARALEQSLWLADDSQRADAILACLRLDPVLVCFLIAELLPCADGDSLSLSELARLAAPSLAMLIADSGAEDQVADIAQLTEPMAQAVVRAEVVRRLAEEHRCIDPGAFELAAMACGVAELFHLSVPRITHWLTDTIGLPDIAAFNSVAVNLLLTVSPSNDAQPIHTSAHLLQGCAELSSTVLKHWQSTDSSAAADLLKLARRLAPLESLQREFASRLETEKLLSMKELAYGAGHEINNPLANISVRTQTLIKQEQDPERRRMLAAINGQVYRAHEMIADLMLFAQPPKLVCASTELQPLLERTVAGLLPDAARQNSSIQILPAETPIVASVDAVQLSLAIHAMIINSLEAMGQGGHIELQTILRRAPRGRNWAEIRIQDDGPGIDDAVRQHLFDPFYSGREAGRGLGFGLSKCWRIVTAHGGRIEVESVPGQSACFMILLPV